MQKTVALLICCFIGLDEAAYSEELSDKTLKDLVQRLDSLTETVSDLQTVVTEQKQRIDTLESENAQLKQQAAPPSPVAAPSAPAATARGIFSNLNPEIGAVVDIVATSSESHEDEEGNDRFSVRELELLVGAEVDPFARFDSTITFSDFEDPDIEEAYVTYWALPWDLKARIGRIRPRIGQNNTLHRHELDTVDYPLVIQRYLGVEGYFRTGVELSRFLPQFNDKLNQELTLGLLEGGIGEDGTLFGESRRRPTFYGHLRNFWTISPTSDVILGTSYMLGSQDGRGDNDVQALGLDAAYQHYFDATRRVKIQTELFAQHRKESAFFDEDGIRMKEAGSPWGVYALADYRFSRRWAVGTRYDYVELVDAPRWGDDDADEAVSAYVTFLQSEYARIRFQFQHVNLASGEDDNRFFLQGTYAIGVHKHGVR